MRLVTTLPRAVRERDHDEVHFTGPSDPGAEETIAQAIAALVACRRALMRIRKS